MHALMSWWQVLLMAATWQRMRGDGPLKFNPRHFLIKSGCLPFKYHINYYVFCLVTEKYLKKIFDWRGAAFVIMIIIRLPSLVNIIMKKIVLNSFNLQLNCLQAIKTEALNHVKFVSSLLICFNIFWEKGSQDLA